MKVAENGAFISCSLSLPSPAEFVSVTNGSALLPAGATLIGLKGSVDAPSDAFDRANRIAVIAPELIPFSVIALNDFFDGETSARANRMAVIAPELIPCSVIALNDFLDGEAVRLELGAARKCLGRVELGLLDT